MGDSIEDEMEIADSVPERVHHKALIKAASRVWKSLKYPERFPMPPGAIDALEMALQNSGIVHVWESRARLDGD